MINLGIIGFGFMGKTYAYAAEVLNLFYPDAPKVNIKRVATSSEKTAKAVSKRYGINASSDVDSIISDKEIDAVYIATPNKFHYDNIKQAIEGNKHLLCEKPMALNLEEADEVCSLVRDKKLVNHMVFEYRYIPAIMKIKELISKNAIGNIIQFRALYLHGSYVDPQRPMSWRLTEQSGALMDLGPHVIDLVNFLVDPITEVISKKVTKIPRRPKAKGDKEYQDVNTDDIAWLLCETKAGVSGSIEVSRLSTGCVDDLRLEIHGEKGAFKFSLENLNYVEYYNAEGGFTKIPTFQNYPEADFPPPKVSAGWLRAHIHTLYLFLKAIEGVDNGANFNDGYAVQKVIEQSRSK